MFAVIWQRAALDELADAWVALDPAGRAALGRELEALNARLADDPESEGESREAGRRVGFAGRGAVTFRIDPDVAIVRVGHFSIR